MGVGSAVSSGISGGNELAVAALVESTIASCTFPVLWPLTQEIFMMQCDPQAVWDAGLAWFETAEALGEAINASMDADGKVRGTGWEGEDQAAYVQRVQDFCTQLQLDQVVAFSMGIALTATAAFLSLLILAAFLAASFYAVCAITYWSLLAGVYTAPLAEALWVSVEASGPGVIAGFKAASTALDIMTNSFAGWIGALVGVDLLGQTLTGNPEVLTDFAKGTVDSIGTITSGLMSYFLNRGIGEGIGASGFPIAKVLGLGGGISSGLFGEEGFNPANWPKALDPTAEREGDGKPDHGHHWE